MTPQMMQQGPMPMPPMQQMPPMHAMPPYMQQPMPAQLLVRPVEQPLPTDKEQLGEHLYPMVEAKDPRNAAKITGMLLEMEIEQIHNIIKNPDQLNKWISEAMKVLNNSGDTS